MNTHIDHRLQKSDIVLLNEVGDEDHTLLKYPAYSDIRDPSVTQYFSKYPSHRVPN